MADENLVLHAIQWPNVVPFRSKYNFYPSEEARNEAHKEIMEKAADGGLDDSAKKVTMFIRVETEYDSDT